jgi:hypothetical protein
MLYWSEIDNQEKGKAVEPGFFALPATRHRLSPYLTQSLQSRFHFLTGPYGNTQAM